MTLDEAFTGLADPRTGPALRHNLREMILMALCSVLNIPFLLSPGAIALGVGFSFAVGVIFGWAPANKASRLNPIDALRSN